MRLMIAADRDRPKTLPGWQVHGSNQRATNSRPVIQSGLPLAFLVAVRMDSETDLEMRRRWPNS